MNPGDSIGLYQLGRRLAFGSMGEVWQVSGPQGDVAIKFIPDFLMGDKTVAQRLRREAETARKLVHPGIVRIYDFGEDLGRAYLVMELLSGETLADYLDRQSIVPIGEIDRIAADLSEVLAYIHERDVLHRDLKPQNVFLTENGSVKLIDLGVAKVLNEASMTATGTHLGTPAYMSPESFRDSSAVTAASDVWSLGVLIYTMATGQMPFSGSSASSIITKIVNPNQNPPPPSLVRPDLPARISERISRCLDRDPAKRPSSAELMMAWSAYRTHAGRRPDDGGFSSWAKRLWTRIKPAARRK